MISTIPKPIKKGNYASTEQALYFVEDIMQRAMIPFVLLGDIAKAVIDNQDVIVNDPVTIGITRRSYTEYAKSTLPMFLPPDTIFANKEIKFEHNGTPVNIKIIDRNYQVLKNPDQVFYRITHFNVPNPFDKYWKMRNLIQ